MANNYFVRDITKFGNSCKNVKLRWLTTHKTNNYQHVVVTVIRYLSATPGCGSMMSIRRLPGSQNA